MINTLPRVFLDQAMPGGGGRRQWSHAATSIGMQKRIHLRRARSRSSQLKCRLHDGPTPTYADRGILYVMDGSTTFGVPQQE